MFQHRLALWLFTCLVCPSLSLAQESESPQSIYQLAKLEIDPSLMVKSQFEAIDQFPVHSDGAIYELDSETYLQVRVGLKARYEFDKNVYLKLL